MSSPDLRQRILWLLRDFDVFTAYGVVTATQEEIYICVGCGAAVDIEDALEEGNHFEDCEVQAVVKLLETGEAL